MIGDLRGGAASESLMKMTEAREFLKNKTMMLENKRGESVLSPVINVWQNDPRRKDVHSVAFAPGMGRICKSLDRNAKKKYWNTYSGADFKVLRRSDINHKKVNIFVKHVNYLFGDEQGGTDWFITWAAQMIQDPANRLTVTPLHISTHTRTGRGWLSSLLTELVGFDNVSDSSISRMSNEESFKGYMADKVLCIVPEIRQDSKKLSVSEAMKKELTDTYINLNIKYGTDALFRICTRFFLQSNHADAVNIDETDNRINVFANHKPPKKKAYYKELYGAIKDVDFLTNVYSYLMHYKVDESKLTSIIKTNARADLINATKTPTGVAYSIFKGLVVAYSDDMLHLFLEKYHGRQQDDSLFVINYKEVRRLEKEYVIRRVFISGKKQGDSVISVNIFNKWVDGELSDAVEESRVKMLSYLKSIGAVI